MGLDSVELVIETEERFGIRISDEEAPKVITVGDLYNLILSKLPTGESQRCLSAMAFYRVRRALMEIVGASRRKVRPEQSLRSVVPYLHRQSMWPLLAECSGLRFPILQRPAKLTSAIGEIVLLTFGACALLSLTRLLPLWAIWPCWIVGVALLAILTSPWAVFPEGNCRSIGDLARFVADRNVGQLAAIAGDVHRHEVWHSLVRMITNQIGVQPWEVTPHARFVQDLGVE